ncbi:hypothetical protein [Nitrospira moscoviensis]|jgi:hypothetical protein|uniref:Uncharacterized protein n=1 Tax=Nitrospira moscoviensis TaxID=42253 RepID=A0A0K2GA43_NITMO|nr:hypothetical protein [Nitrospira moscoviensis]ALA57744.1 exported protein of unknown function [Nitrospira moscoviensis]
MKVSLALGALILPLIVVPGVLTVWLAAAGIQAGRRYAFTRR